MIIHIADILNGRKDELAFESDVTIDDCSLLANHSIVRIEPVAVAGSIYKGKRGYWIKLDYNGSVQFACDRCLKPFDYPIEGSLTRELSERDEFDVDWYVVRDRSVDISAVIVDDLLTSLPIQLVCSDDCKGLCSACGVDLNEHQCQCEEESIDPRLASLKQLFN